MATKQSGIRLAKRLDEVGFSDIVQIRNKVMEMRAEGLQVHALHGGEPYFETPEDIKFAAVKALVENQTHYAPSSGLPAAAQGAGRKAGGEEQHPRHDRRSDRDRGRLAGLVCGLSKRARSRRRCAGLLALLDADRRPCHRCAGAALAGAHDHRPPQRNSQDPRAVFHAARRAPSTTTRRRIPAAWSSRAPKPKRLPPSPSSAT